MFLNHGRQSYKYIYRMDRDEEWRIPALPFELPAVISELRGLARGGLE
jgi:hypothetical protein